MRCIVCNKVLSDVEAVHKSKNSYLDTCFSCLGIEERVCEKPHYDDNLERELNEAGFQIFTPEVND